MGPKAKKFMIKKGLAVCVIQTASPFSLSPFHFRTSEVRNRAAVQNCSTVGSVLAAFRQCRKSISVFQLRAASFTNKGICKYSHRQQQRQAPHTV